MSTEDKTQLLVYTRWINAKLAPRGIQVKDLLQDLKSGIVLYELLSELSGDDLKKEGTPSKVLHALV